MVVILLMTAQIPFSRCLLLGADAGLVRGGSLGW